MKRVFTLFCALVLLLSCFSGMAVSAAEAAPVAPEFTEEQATAEVGQTAALTEVQGPKATEEEETEEPATTVDGIPADVQMKDPALFPEQEINAPRVYGAALGHKSLENSLSDAFVDYLKLHFGNCESQFSIAKYKIAASQLDNLRYIIWYEMPELFHVYSLGIATANGILTDVYVKYRPHSDTATEYKTCLNMMHAGAEYLLRGVKNNNALSDVEKALILHDRLAVWTEYDLDNVRYQDGKLKIYAAYGALGEGLAVCQGYAMAYMYLLEQVGIDSDLCSSQAINHSWNIVYIGGKPYYTDVTWDDPTNDWPTHKYFDNYGRVYHTNFMRSYEGIYSNHTASDYPRVDAPTTYDSGWWWTKSNTSIELFGNQMYYVDNTDGSIYLQNDNGDVKVYQHSNPNNGGWVLMSIAGYKLVIGDIWDIKTLDLSNGQVLQVLKPSECNNGGYIEGLKYENGMMYFQLRHNNQSYRYSYSAFKADSTIIGQPKDAFVGSGKTAKITVQAVGDGLTYAWYYKKAGASGYTKSGNQLTDTLTIKMTEAWHGAQFYCVVTDTYGKSSQSNTVTLRMGNFAKITQQPKNGVAANGKTAKITLKAEGDGLTYTWYYKKSDASGYTKSGNQTTNTLSLKMSKAWHGAQFYCVVEDEYGNSVKSNVAKLYIGNAAKITTQPKNASALSGKTAKITVKASGDGLKYAWYYMKSGASSYTKSGNQTTNTLSLKMAKAWHGAKFYCVVTDKYGTSVKSSVVTLKLTQKATITTQPTNATAQSGKTVKVSVEATGDGLTYQWYYAKKGSSSYKKISGATKAAYSVKMSSSVNGRKVYCVVKDKYGNSVKSSVVTLRQFSSISTVATSWKGVHQTLSNGNKTSISNISLKITTGKKVTLTAKSSGTGYNKGTFKYTLKYVKISGDTATYKFTNSVETLTVTYTLSKDLLTINLGSGIKQVYKRA